MIKYGSIEYFGLLTFQDKLRDRGLDKLDLVNLDKLRCEIDIKVKAIELEAKINFENKKNI